jgi:hypothetical protein
VEKARELKFGHLNTDSNDREAAVMSSLVVLPRSISSEESKNHFDWNCAYRTRENFDIAFPFEAELSAPSLA